jgi:hypothetical protein
LSYDATNPSGYDFTAITDDIAISDYGMVGAALQFVAQPAGVAVNEKIPNFQVKIVDANGYLCYLCTDTVTLAKNSGSGTLTDGDGASGARTAVGGYVTFDNFSFNASGIKQLNVSATLSGVPVTSYSNVFSITSYGTANKLSFGTQPASGTSTDLTAWATQPTVRIEDSAGNLVVSDNSTKVTLSCVNPSSGCTLLGTTTVTAVNGIATFTNLRTAETALTNVVLEANSPNNSSLSSTQSNSFNGNLGAPYALTFSTQPNDSGETDPWSTQPVVKILDNQGHAVTNATNTVTVSCLSASSTCTLSGTLSKAAVGGVATFTNLGTNEDDLTSIVIEATSTGLVSVQSNAFTGVPAP